MASPFIGQLMTVGFSFPPRNWATCQGQILSIAQNSALFSLLGTQYGGNGQTTFALPNLQSRVDIGQGSGPGLTPRTIGEQAGAENTSLLTSNMAAHVHPSPAMTLEAVNVKASEQAPQTGAYLGRGTDTAPTPDMTPEIYVPAAAAGPATKIPLGGVNVAGTTGISGNSNPFSTLQPYLVLNQVISLQGIFPSRN